MSSDSDIEALYTAALQAVRDDPCTKEAMENAALNLRKASQQVASLVKDSLISAVPEVVKTRNLTNKQRATLMLQTGGVDLAASICRTMLDDVFSYGNTSDWYNALLHVNGSGGDEVGADDDDGEEKDEDEVGEDKDGDGDGDQFLQPLAKWQTTPSKQTQEKQAGAKHELPAASGGKQAPAKKYRKLFG